jgi:hypothetical protein
MSIDTSAYVTATVSQWRGRLILLKGHGRGAATGGSSCSAEEQVQKRGYIVIVETDDLIRDLLERWLGEAGYAVVATAADVAVQERPVRLVIVNISSPRGVSRDPRTWRGNSVCARCYRNRSRAWGCSWPFASQSRIHK